jgi:hypothetical protein
MCSLTSNLLLLLVTASRASWVDPDTPKQFHATEAFVETDTRVYELVRCRVIRQSNHQSQPVESHNVSLPARSSPMNSMWRAELLTTEMILDGLLSTRTIVSLYINTVCL